MYCVNTLQWLQTHRQRKHITLQAQYWSFICTNKKYLWRNLVGAAFLYGLVVNNCMFIWYFQEFTKWYQWWYSLRMADHEHSLKSSDLFIFWFERIKEIKNVILNIIDFLIQQFKFFWNMKFFWVIHQIRSD